MGHFFCFLYCKRDRQSAVSYIPQHLSFFNSLIFLFYLDLYALLFATAIGCINCNLHSTFFLGLNYTLCRYCSYLLIRRFPAILRGCQLLPGFAFTFNFSFLPFLRLRFPALTVSFFTGFFMTWIRTFLLNPLAVVIVMTALLFACFYSTICRYFHDGWSAALKR